MKNIVILLIILSACAPAPVSPKAATYTYYFPVAIRPPGLWGLGVASAADGAYQNLLGASWFYNYGWCDKPGCVDMSYSWGVPTVCRDLLIVGNEPASNPPYGGPMLPQDAATASWKIRTACPNTWLVVGNVALPAWQGIPGVQWLEEFAMSGTYDQLGIHCYIPPGGTLDQCIGWIKEVEDAFPKAKFCLTEFGSFNEDIALYRAYLDWALGHFSCLAGFSDHYADWQSTILVNVNFINDDGTLSDFGREFQSAARGAFWR